MSYRLEYLRELEAESIAIFREVVAVCHNPVLLYSIGKDSAVLLHLARKAFSLGALPFPLLHIDTTYKFREMIEFREALAASDDIDMLVHTNTKALEEGINPFDFGSSVYTDAVKTEALKQALTLHGFDAAFGGARRDEEKSRAKERVCSVRDSAHRWNPRDQRPELWNLYNLHLQQGDSLRVFPLSNWTERDVWEYILQEGIPVVPLYFAARRPVVQRGESLIMVDDDRLPLQVGETPEDRMVRFRTLGCYPLTGAVESSATSVEDILQELDAGTTSERKDRLIDSDTPFSMEKKKVLGYF